MPLAAAAEGRSTRAVCISSLAAERPSSLRAARDNIIANANNGNSFDTNGQSVTFKVAPGTDPSFDMVVSCGIQGSGSVTKANAGWLLLSGTNSYSGPTTINNGALLFATPASLYNGSSGGWTAANIIVNGGVVGFDVGGNGGFTGGNINTLLTNIDRDATNGGLQSGTAIALVTPNGSGSVTVSGSIQDTTGSGGGRWGWRSSATVPWCFRATTATAAGRRSTPAR